MSTAAVGRAVVWPAVREAARLTALVASGLLGGAVLAVWLADVAVGGSAALYVEYRQATTGAFTATLPLLGWLALLGAAGSAVLGRGRGRVLALAAAICFVAAMAVTVVVHFPLNAEILAWSPAAPPTDWQQVRDRWTAAHSVRTLLTLAGFGLLTLELRRGHELS